MGFCKSSLHVCVLVKAEIDKFRRFADKVEQIHEENNKVAMDLDDAPDEFRGR